MRYLPNSNQPTPVGALHDLKCVSKRKIPHGKYIKVDEDWSLEQTSDVPGSCLRPRTTLSRASMPPQTLVTEVTELLRVHSITVPHPVHTESVEIGDPLHFDRVGGCVDLLVNEDGKAR